VSFFIYRSNTEFEWNLLVEAEFEENGGYEHDERKSEDYERTKHLALFRND